MAQTLNTEVTRYEAPRKVTGDVRYAADFMPAGMLHGALAVSSIAKGKLTGLDIAAATGRARRDRGLHARDAADVRDPRRASTPAGPAPPASGR